ncbi:MAG: orotidine 5'-phosphate decarboxylase [Armatimonadetes bacterium]|nr:orotidine 5'-phosphate decarboxylase [Armatimonadota bacterium]
MSVIVQISLDLTDLYEAIKTAEIAVMAGVDWLEAGTPLILAEGLRCVRELKATFPDRKVVADLKTMDAGYLETEMMAKAGADLTVVMSRAHDETVRGAVRAARDYGTQVMADIMLEPDLPAAAKRMEALGADYIIHHIGYDERHAKVGKSPLDELASVVGAVSIPVQAVGGLTLDQAALLPSLGAPLVVIGAPLVIDDQAFTPSTSADALESAIRTFVQRAKGLSPA